MALLHSTKLTHYFAPSKSHLESFFDAVTDLYEEQEHTDLNLVAADGTAFRVHQVRARARARRCPASQFLVNWLDFSLVKYPKFDDGAISVTKLSQTSNSDFFFPSQVLLASCSPFVRGLLESGAETCQCEALTIHLPDFDSATVKSLLCILYTGKKSGIAPIWFLQLLNKQEGNGPIDRDWNNKKPMSY